MIEDELSKLPDGTLADYRGDDRLDRVWRRLEPELGARPQPSRPGLLYLPAFGLSLFVLGVFVGRAGRAPAPLPTVLAEPPAVVESGPRPVAPAGERRADPERTPPPSRPRQPLPRLGGSPALASSLEAKSPVLLEPPPQASASPAAPPEWQSLAELGDLAGARAALERQGGFETAFAGASAEVLMTLVDIARATGSRDYAVSALRRLLSAHADAPEAPLAAWTLGNLLEQSGDRAGAAEAFALYRRLSPTGDFAEDAAARQVESALSEGDLELARRLVDQYAKDFPQGRRVAELRDELAKAGVEAGAAGAAGTTPADAVPTPAVQSEAAP
jgi:hypothetical protein